MNIFRNYIPFKTEKFDCKIPEWINALIISALKERFILLKRYYGNGSEYIKVKITLNGLLPSYYGSKTILYHRKNEFKIKLS